MGDWHHDTRAVGMLAAIPWRECIRQAQPVGSTHQRRLLSKVGGTLLFVPVYGPYVGAMTTTEHLDFLQDTIDVTIATALHHGLRDIWIAGDLNLRGVAPGQSKTARKGSSHDMIASAFKDMLTAVGWTVLNTGPTHNRGGALDIRIINMKPLSGVQMAQPLRQGTAVRDQRDQRGVSVFVWKRDDDLWRQALDPGAGLLTQVKNCFQDIAVHAVQQPPPKSLRSTVATATQLILDMIFDFMGIAAGMLCKKSARSSQHTGHIKTGSNIRFMISDMRLEVNRLAKLRAGHARDQELRHSQQVQQAWLDLAVASSKYQQKQLLQQSWVQAAKSSDMSIQSWLTMCSRTTSPRMSTATDAEVEQVLQTRAEIGRLDPRCDAEAEERAVSAMHVEHGKRRSRISNGRDTPWFSVGCQDKISLLNLGINKEAQHFVAIPTLVRLILKRRSSKVSSRLPWAAYRAAAKNNGPVLIAVHSLLEITWATVEIDNSSMCVEVEHIY